MRNRTKKILVISNMYPSKKDPYYGTFVKVFFDSLNKESFCKSKLVTIKGRKKNSIVKIFRYFTFYLKVLFYLAFYNYDLIYTHTISHTSPPLKIISKLKKLNLIFNIHGNDLLPTTKFTKILRDYSKPLLEKSILIVVPSEYYKKVLIQVFPSIYNDKIIISPSGGINKNFYTYNSTANNNEIFHIGFVSRIDKGKGWDILIKALSILKSKNINFKASIYGRGSQSDELRHNIINYGLQENVSYFGPRAHDTLPEIYKSFDIFVFPTTRDSESLGLVGLEAMASGVPVIGSRIGGLKSYIIDNCNGFLFTPGCCEELSNLLIKYIQMPMEDKCAIKKNAFNTSLLYESTLVNKKLMSIINKIIK